MAPGVFVSKNTMADLAEAFQALDIVKKRIITVKKPTQIEKLKEKEKEIKNTILQSALPKRIVKVIPPSADFLRTDPRDSIKTQKVIESKEMPPRKLKKVVEEISPESSSNEDKPIVAAKYFEKKTEVLSVDHVEVVRLVLHEHAGKSYYREPIKNKLFTRLGSKSVGPYIGRWDARNERIIADIPDSDSE